MIWKKDRYKILEENKIQLSGLVSKYGLNKSGILFAILHPNKMDESWYNYRLAGISLEKGILWENKESDFQPNELRISDNGDAYISSGNEIRQISEDGQIQKSVTFKLETDQEIGSFVLIIDGFILTLQGKKNSNAKVQRVTFDGEIIWETPISTKDISYKGLVQMSAKNNWKAEEIPSWNPKSWNCLTDNEIIVSGENILVNYFEFPGSGIGMSFCLNIETGIIKWTTKPAPFESICGLNDGKFLIGHQGYGAFDTNLLNSDGEIVESWKSVGTSVVNANDQIFAVEMDNHSDSKLHFVELIKGNKIKTGKRIPGYYIIHPVLDDLENVIFWRNNELMVVDNKGNLHKLFAIKPTDRDWTSDRMLLHQNGTLIFSINESLYILKTTLGNLEKGSWACKYSNNERNPVIKNS